VVEEPSIPIQQTELLEELEAVDKVEEIITLRLLELQILVEAVVEQV
jgi:hypothetical protein